MISEIKSIFIIGAGNVASHLLDSYIDLLEIKGIYSKNGTSSKYLSDLYEVPFYKCLSEIPEVDLILIAINDSSIKEVIENIKSDHYIAYTSGSFHLNELENERVGVFYPLQTFSKNRKIDISKVPFLIEAKNENFAKRLYELAQKLSKNVQYMNSEQREKIHVGAVIINNFVNHLAYISEQFLNNNNLDFNLLKPLLLETTQKIIESSPYDSQTGPARRNDTEIINKHLIQLSEKDKNIYKVLSDSILKTYHKE